MKRFLVIILDVLSFGITFLIRMLVKKKHLKNRYDIDLNGDGYNDITITFNETDNKEE